MRMILTRCASLPGCGLDKATALAVPYGLQTRSEGGYGRLEIVLGQGHGVAPGKSHTKIVHDVKNKE